MWKRDEKTGHMQFINADQIEAQKKVIGFLLKKIGSNIIKGKSVMGISLPIEIFETRSTLERFACSFVFAPDFLTKAALADDPVETLKYCQTFLLTTSLMFLTM